ncbi:MAG: hypothetical protein ACLPPV_01265 [Candidatus Korobacteraceae bacterium]|jgi:hypothetical protein
MKKLGLLFGFVLLLAALGFAQNDYPLVEASVDFSFVNVHPNLSQITSFNLFGGGGAFVYNITPIIGIKADFFGYTQGSGLKNQIKNLDLPFYYDVSGNAFTYMFGPQFKNHSSQFQPFFEPLIGAAHTNAYTSILRNLTQSNYSGDNNGLALELGGGLDIVMTKNIQIRPFEVDWLYTHFGANHIKNYSAGQNNLKYVGGLNFTFGSK